MHLKRGRRLLRYVKSLTVAIRSQENVIVNARVNRLAKHVLQMDDSRAVRELPGPGILKPALRSHDGIEGNFLGAAVDGDHRRHRAGTKQVSADVDRAYSPGNCRPRFPEPDRLRRRSLHLQIDAAEYALLLWGTMLQPLSTVVRAPIPGLVVDVFPAVSAHKPMG